MPIKLQIKLWLVVLRGLGLLILKELLNYSSESVHEWGDEYAELVNELQDLAGTL